MAAKVALTVILSVCIFNLYEPACFCVLADLLFLSKLNVVLANVPLIAIDFVSDIEYVIPIL